MLLALVALLWLVDDRPQPVPPAPAKPAATAASKTVCWVEEPVGSHLPKRYCAPRSYWETRQRQDQQSLTFWSAHGGGGGGGGTLASAPATGGSASR